MTFADLITPKNTEEIKPDLFIQRTPRGYRHIYPAAWDRRIRWKNFLFGGRFVGSFMWFLILIFLAWSYTHDIAEYQDFYINVVENPVLWCADLNNFLSNNLVCTDLQKKAGLCITTELDLGGFVYNGSQNSDSISGN